MGWYNQQWRFRNSILLDHTANLGNNLCYHQVPIVITGGLYNNFINNGISDGSDIRITDSNGTTLLNHTVERVDVATSSVYMLVKIPSVSSGEAKNIYMYWGNPVANNTSTWEGTLKPNSPPIGPYDIYTQADRTGFNDSCISVLLKHQHAVNGGGSGLNNNLLIWIRAGSNSNGHGNPDMVLLRSSDSGLTFSKTMLLAHSGDTAVAIRTAGELYDGTIVMSYGYSSQTDWSTGHETEYVATSIDGGFTYRNLSTTPTRSLATPWQVGTDLAATYGKILEQGPGGELLIPGYQFTTSGVAKGSISLLRCSGGADYTDGNNWSRFYIMATGVTKAVTEMAVVQNGSPANLIAIFARADTGTDGDLGISRSYDSGRTWETTYRLLGIPGVSSIVYQATSPWAYRLRSGNILLAWSVRYGYFFGCAAALSTDGGQTFTHRPPVFLQGDPVDSSHNRLDYAYPVIEQFDDDRIFLGAYRGIGPLPNTLANIYAMKFNEDYIANNGNFYNNFNILDSGVRYGVATLSSTFNSAPSSIRIDNSFTNSQATVSGSINVVQLPRYVNINYWKYIERCEDGVVFRCQDVNFNTKFQITVSGNRIKWYEGSVYRDINKIAATSGWYKSTVSAYLPSSTPIAAYYYNNNLVATGLSNTLITNEASQYNFLGSSLSTPHNNLFELDDFYSIQYSPAFPLLSFGSLEINTQDMVFKTPVRKSTIYGVY